ncbi:dihydrofolate reductase [Mogibacterium diversum]|uniref:dihydrofolate reductase n=1 Tax=Mogibacterium diversum TaxID=114527 RepID=UPI0028EA2CCB|nr:dihydrofolate reductase [Mogibacterium diversum]
MNLIVAVDERWGIGCDNDLLASIPGDMQYFKEKTTDGVVVMGRRTLESLPKQRGLPKRINYVLTSNSGFEAERCIAVHSEEELFKELEQYDPEHVFIIGGESIYRKFYKNCDKCFVTKMHADLHADKFMVNLDEDEAFKETWKSEMHSENGIDYEFTLYERV